MLIKNIDPVDLITAAHEIPVGLPYTPYEAEGGYRARFVPDRNEEYKKENGHYRYQRRSAGWHNPERKIFALCWHGYREVLREIFKLSPKSKIYTALAKKAGIPCYTSQNFEEVFEQTGHIEIGAPIMPIQAREACFCSETGDDYDGIKCTQSQVNAGLLVRTNVRQVKQKNLTSECWFVQMWGLDQCETCEVKDTPDCGGKEIRETLKNSQGLSVPV